MTLKQGDKVRFVNGIEAQVNRYETFTCGSNELDNRVFIEELGTWYWANTLRKI